MRFLLSKNHHGKQLHPHLLIIGSLLSTVCLMVAFLSGKFDYDTALTEKPIITFVILQFLSGAIYMFLFKALPGIRNSKINLRFILLIGLLLRILYLFTTPILEDDFYRYLWDGANLAHGINPYRIPPQQLINPDGDSANIPEQMKELARESGHTIHRINHPYVRTIYPVISQMFFALAYLLNPWSLFSWKLVLLIVDIIVVYILLKILKFLKIPPLWIAFYWWNPLLLKEIFNSGHMDILIFPFLFIALYLSSRQLFLRASGSLGLAVNIKFWPALLLPLILKPLLKKPLKIILPLFLFILLILLTLIPAEPMTDLNSSAFYNYSTRWELNDSLFKIFLFFSRGILTVTELPPWHDQLLARSMVVLILMIAVIIILKKKIHGTELYEQGLIIVTVMFLISPTQYPWYYCWLIPFLSIRPRFSLLLFTPLLSLYYLRYYFVSIDQPAIFDHYVVWLQYVPVWIFLLLELYKNNNNRKIAI